MVRNLLLAGVVLTLGCKPSTPRDSTKPTSGSVRARVEAEKSAPRAPSMGTKRISGDVRDLRASPDGQLLTVLVDAATPTVQGAPPTLKVGELYATPVGEGDAKKIARNVVNMPGGWLFSADSRWLVVTAGWDISAQAGELLVQDAHDLKAEVKRVSAAVSYFVISEDSTRLAFVEGGTLHVGPLPDGPFPQVAGDVATAEFGGPDLYFRRKFSSGGTLARVTFQNGKPESPKTIADYAGDYDVTSDRKFVVTMARARPNDLQFELQLYDVTTHKVTKLAEDAARFRLTRDGKYVAWRSLSSTNIQADVGEVWVAELGKGEPRKLGTHVKDFDFSPDSQRLVYRENFKELVLGGRDAKPGEQRTEKVGDLYMVELPAGAPKLLQRMCPNYLFSSDGKTLAYTARIEIPEVTRRLYLWREGKTEVRAVKDWLYEYQFRPPGNELVFRADCLREGRSCDLLTLPVDAAKETLPTKHVEGTFGVRFSTNGAKALIASAHLTDGMFDLTLRDFASGEQKTIDQFTDWPALILGDQGQYVAYLVNEKKRSGLYVAALK